MPSPLAHSVAGACIAAAASRRLPATRTLPVAAVIMLAANLPDLDYLALVRGREAMERFHQGAFHSIGFVAAATLPLAVLLRRRFALPLAWLLLAGACLSHLALDLMTVDHRAPIGFPFLWPLSTEVFHSPISLFPGIDRSIILGERNLHALLAELAWSLPTLPLLRLLWREAPRRRAG